MFGILLIGKSCNAHKTFVYLGIFSNIVKRNRIVSGEGKASAYFKGKHIASGEGKANKN